MNNDSEIDALLVLPADDIEYGSLSMPTLVALAIQTTDPFIATSALGELAQRDPRETTTAAERILDGDVWDPHLTAFALTLLYDRSPEAAMLRMQRLARSCDSSIVLAAMMENILSDSDRFTSPEPARLARAIAHRVAALRAEQFKDLEQRDRFLERFGGRSDRAKIHED
jgi:hypothetical protein